ncbi:MAG: DUF4860 domain-containing protein [Oscillospiraceae bacterium]|jgi:hypothetical protein|nr:DUF4860 domain-containing protein [Oscillospiraceae bacterium]
MVKSTRERRHAISGAFVFLLLGLFAVLSTMLVLFGVQAYQATIDRTAEHNQARIGHAFVRNALQADDRAQAVTIERMEGLDVLTIAYDYDGEAYVKRIYCHNGALRELFTEASRAFDPTEGESICPAQSFAAERRDGLIYIEITDGQGHQSAAQIAPRCL